MAREAGKLTDKMTHKRKRENHSGYIIIFIPCMQDW